MSVDIHQSNLDDLFSDLNHPNPNIQRKAFVSMRKEWPKESIERLINNLDSSNIHLRRISVKAIAFHGVEIIYKIVELYFSSANITLKISCLKILVILASNYNLDDFQDDIDSVTLDALQDDSTEIILTAISLLRQLGTISVPQLKKLCRDENVLKAKAAITALIEISEPSLQLFLVELSKDLTIDLIIRNNAIEALNY